MSSNDSDGSGSNSAARSITSSSSRRRFLAATGAGTTVSLAGCLGMGGGSDDVINAALVGGPGDLVDELLDEYVIDETGVEVDTSILPFNDLLETLSTNFEGEDDTYDIVMMDDPWFPRFADHLDPLRDWVDDVPEDEMIDATLSIGKWPPEDAAAPPGADGDPTLKALCAVGNAQLMVYNEALYDEVGAGEPETWEDVYETGQQISDDVDDAEGYVIRGEHGNPIMADFYALGVSMAGPMFDDDWNFNWDSDEGVEAFEFFTQDLASISPDEIASFDSEQVLNSLGDGSAAAAAQWPSGVTDLLDEDAAEEHDNIASAVLPAGNHGNAPQQGNWLLGINTYTDDESKEEAGQILESFVSAEAQQQYVELGGVPFRHDTFENNPDAEEWFPALSESLENAVFRPRTPEWEEIEVTVGGHLNEAMIGEKTPEEAVEDATEDVEDLLDDAGYYG